MALLNGQTPAEISKEIVKEAVTPVLHELDGVTTQHLDVLVRKDNRDVLESRGEKYWINNRDRLRQAYLTKTINGLHKQFVKYVDKRNEDMNVKYYKALIADGMQANEAHKLAFGGGGEQK